MVVDNFKIVKEEMQGYKDLNNFEREWLELQ